MADEYQVIGIYCPECDKSFDEIQLRGDGTLPRHKIPRQHPGEEQWDKWEERFGNYEFNPNWCHCAGLPKRRVIGSISIIKKT